MNTFNGLRVMVSAHAEKDGDPVVVRRSWRDRWLSWPWRPWVAQRTHIPRVPAMFQTREGLLVHPALIPALRAAARIGQPVVNPPERATASASGE
jgi:hypothetical protein